MGSDYAALFHEKWIDGAVLMSIMPGDKGFLNLCVEEFPIVMTSHYSEEIDVPTVDIENTQAGYQAVEYLIEMGHKRIALISGPVKLASCRMRIKGYMDAHARFGLPVDPNLIIETDFNDVNGYKAMQELLSRTTDIDAVFALSDIQAIGAMRALREAGIQIPEDISIIGFDGISVTEYLDPSLTTVAQPAYQKGQMAAEMLLNLIEGKDLETRHVVLPHELVKRASVRDRRRQ
jgi:LacI family repressor for deo operon, udp, cdd, tsx, nupC, and nupG